MTNRPAPFDRTAPKVMCLSCPARQSFLCSGLDDHQLQHLAARASRFELMRGKNLILEGDPTDNVYNIISGDVAVSRVSSDGRRQILGFLSKGDFVGLTLSENYSFSAEALSDAKLCRFDRRSLDELVERFPEMDRQLRRMGAAAMDAMLDLVFALGRKTAQERVASFLIGLSHKQGGCDDPALHVHLAMTRSDIADYLGLTIETVSRILSRLKSSQIIRIKAVNQIEILDLDQLQSLADADLS
ncbi:transcriptional regulator [Iodidimonas muriae]|uniref:Transcriptional regulator n=1 Tax=Iodidimonas muriae TaxID=261467 RepID=A0ABQ2LFG9_9PROT|nr:helix-turn-helix domain-containing protein [Iodidimonas muriae]GER07652.1 transcriptional regulator [Kordiimonadales bacterium JCM 17843]GGO14542.1 transcriptional regulator [Iodidimonas muriae]